MNSKLLEVLPEDYGYVIFVALASNFFNMYLARNVMKARKEFAVEVRSDCKVRTTSKTFHWELMRIKIN